MSSHDKVESLNSWCPKDSNIQVQLLIGLSQSEIVLIITYRCNGEHSSFWVGYGCNQCGCCCMDWMSVIPGGNN